MENQVSLFRSKRFIPLFITQFFGAFNDNAFKNAFLIWFTYDVATFHGLDASLMLTLAGGLFILPFFLFSACAGQLADKYDKAWLCQKIKLVEIILMLFCGLFFYLQNVTGLLVILFLMGVQSTFFGPIKYSLLPEHLAENELISANAWIEGGTFLSILLGTIFGGIVITIPNGLPILSVCLLIFSLVGYFSAFFIPKSQIQDPHLKISRNIFKETVNIISFARKNKIVWQAILAISWFWFIGITFLTLFPLYTLSFVGGNEYLVTFFMTIFSVGIGLGSMLCNSLLKGKITAKYVPLSALLLSLSILLLYYASVSYVSTFQTISPQAEQHLISEITQNPLGIMEFFKQSPHAFLIVFSLFFLSLCGGMYIVPLYAIMQHHAEKSHVSRIIAGNNIINALFMVLASLVASLLLTSNFTSIDVFAFVGIVNFIVSIVLFINQKKYNSKITT